MIMKPSNVKKKKVTIECDKKLSLVILELHSVKMKPSYVKKK